MLYNMLTSTHTLPDLPPSVDLETVPVLKALAEANRALAELKGRAAAIPNQGILIDTLALQEAKASSEIENIVTTQDELFRVDLSSAIPQSAAAKEVARYQGALKLGFDRLTETDGIITNNTLIEMFQLLKGRSGGFRATPGTALKNDRTGKIVYEPPQDANQIVALMTGLERFINDDEACSLDPLIKMALIHHQFESIHPFPDGNGRIGRILNVLYLTRTALLEIPILYLSRHIIRTKNDYYRLLQAVRTELPKLYSQDLLNNLFRYPYTRIEFVMNDLRITRQTATRYLSILAEQGFVRKHRIGRNNYYINTNLVQLLVGISEESP